MSDNTPTCDWAKSTEIYIPECQNEATYVHWPRYADPDKVTRRYCEKHRCGNCTKLEVLR